MTPDYRLLRFAVYALSLVHICLALSGGIIGFSPVPFWDMWDGTVNFVLRFEESPIGILFEQHNEHRLILSRLFFLVDNYVFDGTGVFLVVCNYFLVFLIWVIFSRCLYVLNSAQSEHRDIFLLIAIVGAWMFLWAQRENFTWAFQSQFFLAQLLPLMAFLMLSRSVDRSGAWNGPFCSAILLGSASALTMANGVFALPFMAIWALVMRMKRIQVVVLALLGGVILSFYFADYYRPSHHGSVFETAVQHPAEILIYTFGYLGNPGVHVAGTSGLIKSVSTIAGFSLSVFAACATVQAVRKRPSDPVSAGLLLFIIYVGASAFVTAGGRLVFGFETAFSSRYTTPVLMAWAALFCIWSPQILRLFRSSKKAAITLLSSTVIMLCLLLVSQVRATFPKNVLNHQKAVAVLALELGVNDAPSISVIYPNTDHVLQVALRASNRDLGIFGTPRFQGLRESIGQTIEPGAARECPGQLGHHDLIDDGSGYIRVTGWQYDSKRQPKVKRLFFVDEQNLIVGAALYGRASPEIVDAYGPSASRAWFTGYLRADASGQTLRVVSDICQSEVRF